MMTDREPERTEEHADGPLRGPDGRWEPGRSANPGGRPGGLGEVRELARAYTREAVETLAELMRTGKGPVRLGAAAELLSRGWGRPAVTITGDPEGEALRLQIEAGAGGLLDRLRQLAGVAVLEPAPLRDSPLDSQHALTPSVSSRNATGTAISAEAGTACDMRSEAGDGVPEGPSGTPGAPEGAGRAAP